MKKIVSFLNSILLVISLCSFTTKASVSEVIQDLSRDSSFNVEDYPKISDDYSVKLINIAESKDDNLILYVYQPANDSIDLKAKSVSFGTEFSKDGQNIKPSIYPLQLLSTDGVFDKYKVLNFKVSNEVERFYNIVSLYREVKYEIDKDVVGGITNEKAYAVGEQWCAYDKDDTVVYEMNTFETLEINSYQTGYIKFSKGINIGTLVGISRRGHLHYISFDAEQYVIDYIFDGDISFKTKKEILTAQDGKQTITYGEEEQHKITLLDSDKAEFNTDGFFGLFKKKYKWNRISKVDDFVSDMKKQGVKFNEDSLNNINKGKWVFAFYETPWEHYTYPNGYSHHSVMVYETSILRLNFMDTSGKQYNLGVVNDKVTADTIPDGSGGGVDEDKAKMIFAIVLALIGLAILLSLLSLVFPVFKGLWVLIKSMFMFLWFIISFPFKLIIRFFKRDKK